MDGVFQKLWVVESDGGNFFEVEPHKMIWKTVNGRTIPDFKESVLKHIPNERHAKITSEMTLQKQVDLVSEHVRDFENAGWYAMNEILKGYKIGEPLKIERLDFNNKVREYLMLPPVTTIDKGKDPLEWLEEQAEKTRKEQRGTSRKM